MFILYYSNSGYTKEYAEMFADFTDLKIYSYEELKNHVTIDKEIIFFSNLQAGKINKYKEINQKYTILDTFVCGLDNKVLLRQDKLRDDYQNQNIYYGPGGFNKEKLSSLNRCLMRLIFHKNKEIYNHGINLVEKKYLNSLFKKYQK